MSTAEDGSPSPGGVARLNEVPRQTDAPVAQPQILGRRPVEWSWFCPAGFLKWLKMDQSRHCRLQLLHPPATLRRANLHHGGSVFHMFQLEATKDLAGSLLVPQAPMQHFCSSPHGSIVRCLGLICSDTRSWTLACFFS